MSHFTISKSSTLLESMDIIDCFIFGFFVWERIFNNAFLIIKTCFPPEPRMVHATNCLSIVPSLKISSKILSYELATDPNLLIAAID